MTNRTFLVDRQNAAIALSSALRKKKMEHSKPVRKLLWFRSAVTFPSGVTAEFDSQAFDGREVAERLSRRFPDGTVTYIRQMKRAPRRI